MVAVTKLCLYDDLFPGATKPVCERIVELGVDKESIAIGTLYKEMSKKPCLLDEINVLEASAWKPGVDQWMYGWCIVSALTQVNGFYRGKPHDTHLRAQYLLLRLIRINASLFTKLPIHRRALTRSTRAKT